MLSDRCFRIASRGLPQRLAKEAIVAMYLAQLRVDQHLVDISQDQVAIRPLIDHLRSMTSHGELRIVDLASGAVMTTLPLHEEPEEGDWHQPFPAA
jgi:hypothetical protein